jgi:predicted O-methyltransferase YrrM
MIFQFFRARSAERRRKTSKMIEKLGIMIRRTRPRPSILAAKKLFHEPITIIEIGTYEGDNAVDILKNLRVRKLYCIDPYAKYAEYGKDPVANKLKQAERKARKRLNGATFIREYSEEAAKHILDSSADFVYIDGNHEYEYVKQDIEAYWRKLKPGGMMAGHDIEGWAGVVRAVTEFSVKNRLQLNIKTPDWWVLKK